MGPSLRPRLTLAQLGFCLVACSAAGRGVLEGMDASPSPPTTIVDAVSETKQVTPIPSVALVDLTSPPLIPEPSFRGAPDTSITPSPAGGEPPTLPSSRPTAGDSAPALAADPLQSQAAMGLPTETPPISPAEGLNPCSPYGCNTCRYGRDPSTSRCYPTDCDYGRDAYGSCFPTDCDHGRQPGGTCYPTGCQHGRCPNGTCCATACRWDRQPSGACYTSPCAWGRDASGDCFAQYCEFGHDKRGACYAEACQYPRGPGGECYPYPCKYGYDANGDCHASQCPAWDATGLQCCSLGTDERGRCVSA
ncbi:hypothetical protein ACKKBG_A01635 [Auxenochlorella protothecoides x Auxenochlorella symbiontica]